ncbi:MAG TPA: hypothetical protein VF867_11200 [Arthrobacter sp.]
MKRRLNNVTLAGLILFVLAMLSLLTAIWSNESVSGRFGMTGLLLGIPSAVMLIIGGALSAARYVDAK